MNNIEQIKKQNLETTCRTVARKTGLAHAVVHLKPSGDIILQRDLVEDPSTITYEHTGRI